MLSRITGTAEYGRAGWKAVRALWVRRSKVGLLGKHVDVKTGKWVESVSGIGSNSDSFYEYLLKYAILFDDDDAWVMFREVYEKVMEHMKDGDYYADVDMTRGSGGGGRRRFESLAAFWPGLQVLLGLLPEAHSTLNAFHRVNQVYGFLPERFDYGAWVVEGGESGSGKSGAGKYPLRPELVESTYLMHRATRNMQASSNRESGWQIVVKEMMDNIERRCRTACGYAAVWDVVTGKLEDDMPSYLLSETFKYMYLTLDDDNFMHTSATDWVFTTEAHPMKYLPPLPLAQADSNHKRFFGLGGSTEDRLQKEFRDDLAKTQARHENTVADNPFPGAAGQQWDDHVGHVAKATYLPPDTCLNYHQESLWRQHLQYGLGYLPNYKPFIPEEGRAPTTAAMSDRGGLTCGINDGPVGKGGGKKRKASVGGDKKESPLSATFHMEGLGDFAITSFGGGYLVEHEVSRETIEVANVGRIAEAAKDEYIMIHASAFNHRTQSIEVKTSIADLNSHAFDCDVSVYDNHPPSQGKPLRSFPCTTAAFGPTMLENMIASKSPELKFEAELRKPVAKNEHGCDSKGENSSGGLQVVKRGVRARAKRAREKRAREKRARAKRA